MTRLAEVGGVPVLSVGGETYTWGDVFLAARLWAEWDAFEQRHRRGIAAATADPPPAAELARAEAAWRRERRLLAGDELKGWLARKRLTVHEWRAYIVRDVALARAHIGGADGGAAADELWAEGTCSGEFDRYATRLAERIAAPGDGAAGMPPPDWLARTPSAAEAESIGIDPAGLRRRVERIWAAELAHRRLCAAVRDSDAVGRTVTANNVDWLRVDCELLETDAEDAAREAALLVREDGMPLPEVARQAGLPLAARRLYLGELPAELRPRLASAAPGELVGPVAVNDHGYVVLAVHEKLAPSLDDPEIRARAERSAVAAAVERQVGERVRWHEHD